jgi:hypothetical protein
MMATWYVCVALHLSATEILIVRRLLNTTVRAENDEVWR